MVGGEAAAPGSLRAGEHTFGRSTAEEVGVYPHFLKCTTSGCRKGALPAQGKSQTSERAAKAGSIEAQAANNKIPPQLRSRRAAHSPGPLLGSARHVKRHHDPPPASARRQRRGEVISAVQHPAAARGSSPPCAFFGRRRSRFLEGFTFHWGRSAPIRSAHRVMCL